MTEAKPGEFSLVYNGDGVAHAVGLTKEQHEMLHLMLRGFGKITVIKQLHVSYQLVDSP